jgi:hypothetical protein
MKKSIILSTIVLFAITISTALFASTQYEAANCEFTGISSDYCFASTGTKNVRVLECRPGTGECYFEITQQ